MAYDGAERMNGCRDCWRTLPSADTSAVHERSERVSVMAWTLENFCGDLVRISCHECGFVDSLALFLIESLVDEEIQLDVGARFPQVLYDVEDLEVDSYVLFCALREEHGRADVRRHYPREHRSSIVDGSPAQSWYGSKP